MPPAVAARVRPGLDPVPDRSVALHAVSQPMVAALARPEPKFHEYELADPTPDIQDLLDEIDRDPTSIFWV
jgi:hypothetical protein